MKMTRPQAMTRIRVAAIAIALALVLPAAAPAQAAGLTNCVDVTGSHIGRVGCWEAVWADGVQLRMTFANQQFTGATPGDHVDNFYVLAPQTDTPQGALPFPHDHTVGNVPRQDQGDYSAILHGFFVLCSAEGIATGGCVPTMTSIEGLGTIPLARTVNGQILTSVEPIESAATSGLVALFDTGGVFVATITAGN